MICFRLERQPDVDFYLPKVSLSLDDGFEQIIDETLIGVIEDPTNASVIAKFAEGEIEGNIYYKSFGLILLAALVQISSDHQSIRSKAAKSASHP